MRACVPSQLAHARQVCNAIVNTLLFVDLFMDKHDVDVKLAKAVRLWASQRGAALKAAAAAGGGAGAGGIVEGITCPSEGLALHVMRSRHLVADPAEASAAGDGDAPDPADLVVPLTLACALVSAGAAAVRARAGVAGPLFVPSCTSHDPLQDMGEMDALSGRRSLRAVGDFPFVFVLIQSLVGEGVRGARACAGFAPRGTHARVSWDVHSTVSSPCWIRLRGCWAR